MLFWITELHVHVALIYWNGTTILLHINVVKIITYLYNSRSSFLPWSLDGQSLRRLTASHYCFLYPPIFLSLYRLEISSHHGSHDGFEMCARDKFWQRKYHHSDGFQKSIPSRMFSFWEEIFWQLLN